MHAQTLSQLSPLDFSPSARLLCSQYFELGATVPNLFLIESMQNIGASVAFDNTRVTKDWLSSLYCLHRKAATDFTRFLLSPDTWSEESKASTPFDFFVTNTSKVGGGLYERMLSNAFHLAVETRNIEALQCFLEIAPTKAPILQSVPQHTAQTVLNRFSVNGLIDALLIQRQHYDPYQKGSSRSQSYTLIDLWYQSPPKAFSKMAANPIEMLVFFDQLMLKSDSSSLSWQQTKSRVQAVVTCCLGSLSDKRLPSLLRTCLANHPELQAPTVCEQTWPTVFGERLLEQIETEPRKNPSDTTFQFQALLSSLECFSPSALERIQSSAFSTIQEHLNGVPSYHFENLSLKTDFEHFSRQIDGLSQLKTTHEISLQRFLNVLGKSFNSFRPFASGAPYAFSINDLTKTNQKIVSHLYQLAVQVRTIHALTPYLEQCVSRYEQHKLQQESSVPDERTLRRRVL
jgi:hypothetical protein